MGDGADKDRQEEQAQAFDSLAAATAVSFAVASRSMEMWFGAMSGFARASREMLAPHLDTRAAEPVAETDQPAAATAAPIAKKVQPPAAPLKSAPKAMERPAAVDDLKQVAGIGPKLEQVLNGLGIWTFLQIAEWQHEEIAWVDELLGLNGRIEHDKWIEQAAVLAQSELQKEVAAG